MNASILQEQNNREDDREKEYCRRQDKFKEERKRREERRVDKRECRWKEVKRQEKFVERSPLILSKKD